MRMSYITVAAALAALSLQIPSFAADAPAAAASAAGARGPSPAAIAACAGKAEGTAVTWVGRMGKERSGKCANINGQLAARPDRMRIPATPASGSMR